MPAAAVAEKGVRGVVQLLRQAGAGDQVTLTWRSQPGIEVVGMAHQFMALVDRRTAVFQRALADRADQQFEQTRFHGSVALA